jgi:peptidyl-prolyl cis-trans isomerase C
MPKNRRLLLCLSLAVLVTGLGGCNKDENDAETPATSDQAAQTEGTPGAQPGQPGTPGQTAQPAAPPLAPEQIPEVVARVNGKEINKQELLEGAQQARMQMAQMGQQPPASPNAVFYRQVLDTLVGQTLLLQEAKAQGFTATDAEVERELSQVRAQLGTPEAFQQALAQQKMTEAELKERTRNKIAFAKFVQTQVVSDVPVTEQAIRAFYDQNQKAVTQPERLHLRHILIKVDANTPEPEKQKAREKAEALLERIEDGEDFAQLARENSDDQGSKDKGGDIAWWVRGQSVPSFEQAAFALQEVNDLSPVVQTQFGYHVIQLLERQAPTVAPFEQVKDRIGEFLKQKQARDQIENRVKALKAKGKVEVFL